jgi:hypothetical protein
MIRFEGFLPQTNIEFRYVLIAPDGEFVDGEVPRGDLRGEPQARSVSGRTDGDGVFEHAFSYADKPEGIYTLEIRGDFVVRRAGEPPRVATGNVVCKRLNNGDPNFSVVVIARPPLVTNPTITLASSIVVVKKSYTNPARQRVTLRLDYPFCQGDGTFTRSSDIIRFFDAPAGGTEIRFDGVDNVFSGHQLSAGVQLYAEGRSPSAAMNDVLLTLTVIPSPASLGPPVGPAATATMTSVELTLDICVSRTAPSVAPAPLPQPPVTPPAAGTTATDKWYGGRFVQVRNPSNSHERALLIVRRIQPPDFAGELVLRQVALSGNNVTGLTNRLQIFDNETRPSPPATETAHPNPLEFNAGTPAAERQFWAEGIRDVSAAPRDTGFQLGIRYRDHAGDHLENDGDRVAITVVQIVIAMQSTVAAPAAAFTRFGLCDHAFRADGTVFNEAAEADNFVGADTRRFYIRVHDVSQRGARRINAEWHAVDRHGNDFHAPVSRIITLVEEAAHPGVFVSRGLMTVTDNDDFNQNTHSGLPAGFPDAGLRNRNQSNHRLRRATMEGDIVARYPHPLAPTTVIRERLPVFQRSPEERRRVPLQILVLRLAAGGAGVVPTGPASLIWTRDLPVIRETYERIGISVETVVAPGTPAADIVTVGGDSLVLINSPAGVNPLAVRYQPVNDEATIGAAFPAQPNTIRVFYTGGLPTTGSAGESWPDFNFAAQPQVGACFINGAIYGLGTVAHEVGHVLTNKDAAAHTGHYIQPAVPAGNRLQTNQNLMANLPSPAAGGVNVRKRLWDAVDADGAVNQYTDIRGSHYTHAF